MTGTDSLERNGAGFYLNRENEMNYGKINPLYNFWSFFPKFATREKV